MFRGAWQVAVGCKESDTTERLNNNNNRDDARRAGRGNVCTAASQ